MALLKLPKLLHPNFSRPNYQPVSDNVGIDWGDAFTKGLRFAVVPPLQGGKYPRELVTGTIPTDLSGTGRTIDSDRYGRALRTNNANEGLSYGNLISDLSSTTGITVVCRFRSYTGGVVRPLFSSGENVLGNGFALRYDDVSLVLNGMYINSDNLNGSRTAFDVLGSNSENSYHSVAFSHVGTSTVADFYVDGKAVSSNSTMSITANANRVMKLFADRADNGTDDVGLAYIFVFEGYRPASFINALSKNVYRLLKPSSPPFYFTPSAAGSTYTLTADVNALTLGSDAVALTANRLLNADVNALTLGSDAVTLTANRVLNADVNSLTIGGDDVDLLAGRLLTADVNALALGADDVTLTYNSGATYTLTADVNALTIGGDDVSFLRGYNLTADVNVLTIGGDSVTLTVGVLNTPDCYTWLQSTITDAVFYNAPINSNNEYIVSFIDANGIWIDTPISDPFADEGGEFLQSTIDPNGVFLESCVCLCE